MSRLRRGLARIVAFARKRALDRELDEELAAHLDLAAEEHLRRGLPPEEARRRARLGLGNLDATRERHREARGLPVVDGLLQDLRYSLRMFRRYSALTAFAIVIIAVGVGASATVFSVVHALLVRPLPFEDPRRLVWIENGLGPTRSHKTIQVAHLKDMKTRSRLLVDAAGYYGFSREGDHRLGGPGEPERVTGVRITEDFLSLLGVRPRVGRWFRSEECLWDGPRVVLLSHGLWQRRFAGDPGVVGRSVTIDDAPATVVGVLPESFDFPSVFDPGGRADLFWPFPLVPETDRRGNTLHVVARIERGATIDSVRAEIATLAARAAPGSNRNALVPRVVTLREHVSGAYRGALLLLGGSVGVVMLIVCANLSNLLLTRDSARAREIAVRAALGASRRRLVQQLLTESLVLSCSGAALGLLAALAGTRLLANLDGIHLPLRVLIRIDAAALGFTALIAVATGVLFGLAPAIRLSGQRARCSPDASGRSVSPGRGQGRIRAALVVGEVALACLLLVGAGLLLRSLVHLLDVDLGFRPEQSIALRIDPGRHYPDRQQRGQFLEEALRRVRSVPGVDAAGLTDSLPMGYNRQWNVGAADRADPPEERPLAYIHVVSDGYLRAVGATLAAGRDLDPADDRTRPPVALVNESLARLLWPTGDAVGRSLELHGGPREVVGVVRDVRHLAVESASGAEVYLPLRQTHDYASMHLVLRGDRPPADLAAAARGAIRPLDPSLPIREYRSLREIVDRSISPRRFVVTLLAGFAGFALVLAALGIYGVISFSVSQRTREIGIRMALGATTSGLRRRVLADTLKLATLGLVLGLVASWQLARVLGGLLFGVSSSDPATFLAVPLVLLVVATVAGYLPALRASRLDPALALRAD